MESIRAIIDALVGTKLSEWSIDLSARMRIKLFLKERGQRRYIIMRMSAPGNYQYTRFRADEAKEIAEALSRFAREANETAQ